MIKKSLNKKYISENKRQNAIDEIIGYFGDEFDEQIGIIKAEKFLDFILDKIGRNIYAKGVDDSKNAFMQRIEDIGLEIETLK